MVLGLAGAALAATFAVDLGRGPVPVATPDLADGPVPLIVNLHGYGGDGPQTESYMRFRRLIEERGFAYTVPTGLTDWFGAPYWNATDYCCDFFGDTDDVGYLSALIDAIADEVDVDPARIYLVGHSNGGFMSYRLACEDADRFAALVSLAGATFDDVRDCRPSEPVNILQVHGTRDETILFGGDCGLTCYPSAFDTVRSWATYNGCGASFTEGDPLDLSWSNPGAETRTFAIDDCPDGGAADLWVLDRGGHIPALSDDWAASVVDWLMAHPKP